MSPRQLINAFIKVIEDVTMRLLDQSENPGKGRVGIGDGG